MEGQLTAPIQPFPPGLLPSAPPPGGAPAIHVPRPIIGTDDLLRTPAAAQLLLLEHSLRGALDLARPSLLAARVDFLYEERRVRRMTFEAEWMDAYNRVNSRYGGAIAARLAANPYRSKVFVGLTRMLVDTAHGNIMDVFRGTGSDQPWGIEPEEIPDDLPIPPLLKALGIDVHGLRELFKRRAEGMETEIRNQLNLADIQEILDIAALELCVTGTCFIEGPYTVEDTSYKWELQFDQLLQATAQAVKNGPYRPAFAHLPVVNAYPHMEKASIQASDGFIAVLPMGRREIINLTRLPGYNPAAVLRLLQEHPNGNYLPEPHITQLRSMAGDTQPSESRLWMVKKYLGEVTGRELAEAGVRGLPEEAMALSIPAEIHCSGKYVLKARPLKGKFPVFSAQYRRRSSACPFGLGVPKLAEHPQDAINGAARMTLDNGAIASGPIIEVNTHLLRLEPGENPANIYGWRVYLSNHDGNSNKQAIFVHDLPAYSEQFIAIMREFMRLAELTSQISSISGGIQGTGTTKTATGMSILDRNSDKTTNTTIRNLDDGIIEPLIEGTYDWNMRFNPKEHILVPARCIAKGTQLVMAREMQTQRIVQGMQVSAGQPWFKHRQVARQLWRSLGIAADEAVMSDAEWAAFQAALAGRKPPPDGDPFDLPEEEAPPLAEGAPPLDAMLSGEGG